MAAQQIETVTFVDAPAASEPLVAESVSHVSVFDAVQLSYSVPVFDSVYTWLGGLNGPP